MQQANLAESSRQAEEDREKSAAQTEAERRNQLVEAARVSLDHISTALRDAIAQNAPAARLHAGRNSLWQLALGRATLFFDQMVRTPPEPWGKWGGDIGGLDVVAFAAVNLAMQQCHTGYQGRSHSLWFCNYADRSEYAWFEGAFMRAAVMSGPQPSQVPYALPPSENAAKALSRVMSEFDVAWRFTKLTVDELDDFIDRWANWVAQASTGGLPYPHTLPERR